MVTKKDILSVLKEDVTKPIFDYELFQLMALPKADGDEFMMLLDELEAEGKVLKTKKDKYGIPERFNLVSGKIQVTKKGFAFLLMEDERGDIFIPASELNTAMDSDTVLVKLTKQPEDGRRGEGKVERVIVRAFDTIVGTFEASKDFGFVVADDKKLSRDFYIGKKDTKGAESGDKVVVKITKYSEQNRNPEGRIIDILGKAGTNEAEIQSIIRMHGLPEEFPKKVLRQADRIDTTISQEEIDRRKDFRKDVVVTIDGIDAKDLDDAISIDKLENGNYELGVHIADVTHYVQERSKLDVEALKRGTSVYLVDRVIPMLPKVLSNGICSLNPHEDRLTMSIVMEINKQGKVVNQQIYESIINSKERLTYTDVSDILEDQTEGKDHLKKYDYLNDTFVKMRDLAAILRKSREMRGMIDFNFPEAKVVTDEEGKVKDIVIRERRVSNKIIEEFMLKANETIAEYMYWMEIPFVYRIHENPKEEKIEEFNRLIHNFGYTIKGSLDEIHPREIQKLLKLVEGKKEEPLINKMMLRSLKQAKYSPFNDGHFGLAAQYYCHFTSPIRRYPDLQIHRIIKESLNGTIDKQRIADLEVIVAESSDQASKQERIAEKAERDTVDLKMAEYMSDYVGEEFDGFISSLTSFGMFIQLENTIEGLVRMVDLSDDYYVYDEANMIYIGEHTRKTYHIGDEVKVKVEKVSVKDREIDFVILEHKK